MILSYRIPIPRYETDEEFNRLLSFFRQYPKAADELCLFTEVWAHAYLPLDGFERLTKVMKQRIQQLRDEGFTSVGINMLVTLGHIDAAWTMLPPLPFPSFVGHDGRISKSCACPSSTAFLKYIRDKYALAARANPDFIWVDDDFRMSNRGVNFGCFCPECLKKFKDGRDDRETLVAKLNTSENEPLRLEWVQNNIQVLEDLAGAIASAVHEVNPNIEIGWMSGEDAHSGLAFDRWMKAFGGRRTRPGGGFYEDYEPRIMVRKAFEVGRQCMLYPKQVNNIQYEVECCPTQKLQKSVRSILNECTLSLMAGCNGIAFNAIYGLPGDLNDYQDLLTGIEREKDLWSAIVEQCQGLSMTGLWHAHNEHLFAKRRSLEGKNWFIWHDHRYDTLGNLHFAEIGLPITVDRHHACATLLSGRFPDLFSNEELKQMLSRGVMMDALAVEVLWERGLGELTGVKLGRAFTDNSVYEQFTSHPWNSQSAGWCNVGGLALFPVREFIPISPNVEDFSHLHGADDGDYGKCLCGFTNALGGRIVTMGYSPWTYLGTSWKRSQIITLADWVSHHQLPVIIDKAIRVTPLVRISEDKKRFVVFLLNTSYDPTGTFDLRLRVESQEVYQLGTNQKIRLPFQQKENELIVSIPNIDPWQYLVITG